MFKIQNDCTHFLGTIYWHSCLKAIKLILILIFMRKTQSKVLFILLLVPWNLTWAVDYLTRALLWCSRQIARLVAEGSWPVRKSRDNEKMKRKWRENEEMERDSHSTFSCFLVISSLSIHFLYPIYFVAKCWIRQVANVTKNLTYALWKNNSGSNLLQESSASCEGPIMINIL